MSNYLCGSSTFNVLSLSLRGLSATFKLLSFTSLALSNYLCVSSIFNVLSLSLRALSATFKLLSFTSLALSNYLCVSSTFNLLSLSLPGLSATFKLLSFTSLALSKTYAFPPLLNFYPSLCALYPLLLNFYPSLLTRYPTTYAFPPFLTFYPPTSRAIHLYPPKTANTYSIIQYFLCLFIPSAFRGSCCNNLYARFGELMAKNSQKLLFVSFVPTNNR